MVLIIIAGLLAGFWLFCRAPHARHLLGVAALLALAGGTAFIWAGGQLARAGCDGAVLAGLTCPDPDLLTRLAMAHLSFGAMALTAGAIVAPAAMIVALWLEIRYRRAPSGD